MLGGKAPKAQEETLNPETEMLSRKTQAGTKHVGWQTQKGNFGWQTSNAKKSRWLASP